MPGFGQRPSIPGDSPNRVDDLIPFLCQYFCCQRAASPVCTINQYHFPFRKRNIACLYFFQRQIYRHRNVTFRKFFPRSTVNDDSSIVKSLTQDVPNINIMRPQININISIHFPNEYAFISLIHRNMYEWYEIKLYKIIYMQLEIITIFLS